MAGGFAYVTNYGTWGGPGTVSVISTSTNQVVNTINVGSNPNAVTVAGGYAYVTNSASNTVSVINGSTNTVTDTVPVGSFPYAVAVNPSTNTVYVANFWGNSVSVITPPPAVPSAPTITSATGGSAQATIAWTDGAPNGSDITAQTIYAYSGSTLVTTKTDCSGSPCTVTGLTNATSYTFKASDTNGIGEGALSVASSVVIPLPTPALSVVMPGPKILVPHWTGVRGAHGKVLYFTATAYDLSGNAVRSCRNWSGSGRSCWITGLTGHRTYQVTVTATLRIGTRTTGFSIVTSAPSNQVAGIPLAP